MALTDNQAATKEAIVDAVAAKLEALNADLIASYPDEESKQKLRDGFRNIGVAIAEIVEPVCAHIAANAEVDNTPGLIT